MEDYVQNCILNYMTEECKIDDDDNDFGNKLKEIIEKKDGRLTPSNIKEKIIRLQEAYIKSYKDSNDTEDKLKPIQMLFNNFNPIE